MTVDELRVRMSADEFARWGVYYSRLAQIRQLEALRAKGR